MSEDMTLDMGRRIYGAFRLIGQAARGGGGGGGGTIAKLRSH